MQKFTHVMKNSGTPSLQQAGRTELRPVHPYRMWTLSVLVLASFISVSGSKAETQASKLLTLDDKGSIPAEAVAAVMVGGMNRLNAYFERNGLPRSYCLPANFSLTGSQMLRMLREDVTENPGLADQRYGLVLFLAMKKRFPCK